MKIEHINEIKGIVILALSLLLLASLASFTPYDLNWYTSQPNVQTHNLIGIVGAYMAGVLFFILGLSAYSLVVIGFFWSWNKFTSRELQFSFPKFLSLLILMVVVSSLLSMTASDARMERFSRAGVVGIAFSDFLQQYLSPVGAFIVLSVLGALALVVAGEFMVSPFFVWLAKMFGKGVKSTVETTVGGLKNIPRPNMPMGKTKEQVKPQVKAKTFKEEDFDLDDAPAAKKDKPLPAAAIPVNKPQVQQPAVSAPVAPKIHIVAAPKSQVVPAAAPAEVKPAIVGEYHLPSLDLLKDPPKISEDNIQQTLMSGAKTLEETLADFGVNVKVVDIERGPVITRYELQPAPGVKIQRISSLSDDIALALSASAVRILAPIPGKNRVGVEVPNGSSAAVFLKDVLNQAQLRSGGSRLMLAIGKDTSGKPLIADLAEMPHMLVAGTTGSGKSVCLNSVIMSILFNASPAQVKFIMVDPKMVEMTAYNELPHLICPVITDPKKATAALNWVVGEMERRYKQLASQGVKNIKGLHAKGLEMPYIVVVVDELADLMQVSAKTIEGSIARLAQMARAVGIHLILATQRPSVNVITGVIKANFPSRISFKVASQVDSRTILDEAGAEDLLGKGDLLFMKPGDSKPTRGQCCYVSDDEINQTIDFIKKQGQPVYDESVLKPQSSGAGVGGSDEKDEMYDEAVKVVIETNQASVTILQRRLRLGYSRAARLIDMMEQQGIVGPYAGSKARDILVDREKWLIEHMGNAAAPTQQSDAGTNA
jgi:DNA segregation ATPase FtsK/SpoIIIE, S-DNA-T family